MATAEEDMEYYEGQYDEEGDEGKEGEDPELEEIKRRVQEMEKETEILAKMQDQVESQIGTTAEVLDEHSVYIGQVDYHTTPEELRAHFAPCGTLNKVTIICDKFSGVSKGFAYIKFADEGGVENALKLDNTPFKGRQLKVIPKRQNEPHRGARGRGGGGPRGRGGFRGGRGGGGRFAGGRGGGRFRGRSSYRGRGSYHAAPY
jgi:polyadenylate-binding protein 2